MRTQGQTAFYPYAVNVVYKGIYRGISATDIGGSSPEQTVAAGG